jgi:hypothetical protein
MKTSLLSVPLKTTEEVDWVKPLNNYLLSIYGNTSDYQGDLNNFNKLRLDLRGVHADPTGIKLYYKYYSQIELLDLRVPFASVNKHKKIQFVWHDAFDSTIEHKQHALPFEKANILFNLGALLSKEALSKYDDSQRTNESAELVEAVKLLQQSAGIFHFLSENFLHAPSDDLSQSTLKFVIKLMQAQSQEVFLLKVINGDLQQKQNSLIAKLCRSAAIHYEECYGMIKYGNLSERPVFDYGTEEDFLDQPEIEDSPDQASADIDKRWKLEINFKALYYKSLAFYFNGLQLEANSKYGEAVAYLTKSSDILSSIESEILKPAAAEKCTIDYILADNFKYQQDTVNIKLGELNKDNDLIYNELIPSLVTLPDIKPMDSTKIIAINQNTMFQEINDYNYNNFLTNVVPINIHELLSYYSEEKSQFLRNEIDLVDVSNEELSSALEYLKLPKALVTIKELVNKDVEESSSGKVVIPDELKQMCIEIESKYSTDTSNKQKIIKTRQQIYDNINGYESLLNPIANPDKDELIKLKKTLYDATNSDNQLFSLVSGENSELYMLLAKGEYRKLFTISSEKDSTKTITEEISLLDIDDDKFNELKRNNTRSGIYETMKQVEDILHDLNVVKSNKAKLIDALKREIHSDDISDILILNSKIKSTNEIKTVIFPQELKKFEPINLELDKLVSKQNELVDGLKVHWEELSRNQLVKKIQNSKKFQDELVNNQSEKVKKFYMTWKRYSLGLSKGVDFYQQLLNYSNRIKANIQNGAHQYQTQRLNYGSNTPGFQQQNYTPQSSQLTGSSYQGQYQPPPNGQYQPKYQPGQCQQQMSSQHSGSTVQSGEFGGPLHQPPFQTQYHQPGLIPVGLGTSGPQLPNKEQNSPPAPPPNNINPQASFGDRQGSSGNGSGAMNQNYGLSSKPGPDLIYNQPSTYQPDMYNFFSKN